MIRYKHAVVDAQRIFYREAGPATARTILLLHGFPTSSHMFRNLIPALADSYRVVAPDLPGFGFSDTPDRKRFRYCFENLARVIDGFTQTIGLQRFAIYLLDYASNVALYPKLPEYFQSKRPPLLAVRARTIRSFCRLARKPSNGTTQMLRFAFTTLASSRLRLIAKLSVPFGIF